LTNNSAVGYYSAAEKIMRAVAMLMGPLAGALFPNSAKNLNNNFSETVKKLYKVLKVAVIIQLIIIIPIFIFSEKITFIIFNDSNAAISDVLKIIIIAPVFMLINNFFGIQIMLNAKKEKEYFLILLIGGFLNLILCSSLTYYYSYIGTAISLLLIEFLIMFLMIVSVKNMEVKI
jgi:PST family polysaccharide transporter